MRCKGQFRLEKLIIGENPLVSREDIVINIVRYLEIKGEPRHSNLQGSMSLRFFYNQYISELSEQSDCSKNATRHNIHYVRTGKFS